MAQVKHNVNCGEDLFLERKKVQVNIATGAICNKTKVRIQREFERWAETIVPKVNIGTAGDHKRS